MRKLTSLILTGAMMMSSIGMTAQAAGRTVTIEEALADGSQIHILYNDKVVEYEDVKPVNTEGRVMIPFRAVLEDMGATVEYDDSQRLVTASKGETQIKFTLMDDTIYINDNGVNSTITMDVPMIIVEGRTLVPIRFMSNALGMQVGWDGDTETVVIMDYDDYFGGLDAIAPNITKLTEQKQPTFNKEYAGFDVFLSAVGMGDDIKMTVGGDVEGTYADGMAQLAANGDFVFNEQELKDIDLELKFKGASVYIKTNLAEKIVKITTDENLKSKLSPVKADTWYKIDLKNVLEARGLSDESVAVIETVMSKIGSDEKVSLKDMLKSMVVAEGDADFDQAVSVAMMMDMFEAMDKYVTVEEKENGTYTISMNMTTSDVIDIAVKLSGEEISEDDKKAVEDFFNFDLSAVSEVDGKTVESAVKCVLNIYGIGDAKIDFTFEMSDRTAQVENAEIEEVVDSTDITQVLIDAMQGI